MSSGGLQFFANHEITRPREDDLLMDQKISPGLDTPLPEILFCLWANALDMDKGMFKQCYLSYICTYSINRVKHLLDQFSRFPPEFIPHSMRGGNDSFF